MTTKILVAGDVKGDLAAVFGRVATLNASKGPFDCLMCVGDFLGEAGAAAIEPYTSGTSAPPLRTYFLGEPPEGTTPNADGQFELCPDLICLSGTGIVTLHALRVAFASGREAALSESVAELRTRTAEPGYAGCDVLLTHEWPRGFHRQLPDGTLPVDLLPDKDLPQVGAESVAELAAAVRPRYHFCGSEDNFFARAPFRQPAAPAASGAAIICRLVALAAVSADKKKKWLHALSLVPLEGMSAEQLAAAPENTTECPYPYLPPAQPQPAFEVPAGHVQGTVIRWNDKGFGFIKPDGAGEDVFVHCKSIQGYGKEEGGLESLPQGARVAYRLNFDERAKKERAEDVVVIPGGGGSGDAGGDAGGGGGGGGGGGAPKRKREDFVSDQRTWVNDSCWFCMASPQFESHFVVSVGDDAYVCMAKGPLLPMHALILPVAHVPCSLMLTPEAKAEVCAYVSALRSCFEARGAALLLFERYMGSGSFEHMHLQALPIPARLAGGARAAFEEHGRRLGISFEVLPAGSTVEGRLGGNPQPFFSAALPSGETMLHLLSTGKPGKRHPLQFGREVVATLLGNPRRADWKLCLPQPAPGERASTQELEARLADDFKQAFASFDPTMQ